MHLHFEYIQIKIIWKKVLKKSQVFSIYITLKTQWSQSLIGNTQHRYYYNMSVEIYKFARRACKHTHTQHDWQKCTTRSDTTRILRSSSPSLESPPLFLDLPPHMGTLAITPHQEHLLIDPKDYTVMFTNIW